MTITTNDTALSRIVEATDARPSGEGYVGHCPSHGGRRRSLKITPRDDGGVLIFDHGGCPTSDVLAAMGMTLKDIMPPRHSDHHRSHRTGWRTARIRTPRPPTIDALSIARTCYQSITPAEVAAYADHLRVTVESLDRLRMGWSERNNAATFPMRNAGGDVIGIRTRNWRGEKRAIAGSRAGIFMAAGFGSVTGPLVIVEGPTDGAAGLDLGFNVIGRPSCSGGERIIVELFRRLRPAEVVILADNDPPKANGWRPGLEGAEALAKALMPYTPALKLVVPPEGVKDLRKWKQSATKQDIIQAIETAPAHRVSIEEGQVHCG